MSHYADQKCKHDPSVSLISLELSVAVVRWPPECSNQAEIVLLEPVPSHNSIDAVDFRLPTTQKWALVANSSNVCSVSWTLYISCTMASKSRAHVVPVVRGPQNPYICRGAPPFHIFMELFTYFKKNVEAASTRSQGRHIWLYILKHLIDPTT